MNETKIDEAIILLGRGGYSNTPRQQLERMVAAVQANNPYCFVIHAMVDQGEPSLPQALDISAQAGVNRVIVMPVFIPGDANLQIWLAKVARRWQAAQTTSSLEIVLAQSLGDHPVLDTALLTALEAAKTGSDVRENPPQNWENDPAGWNTLPPHQHHILVCRGPRCTALGADECWTQLRKSLTTHNLRGQNDRVLSVATGCLYPCNRGPILVVHPDGIWYGGLTPELVERLVEEHLIQGTPLKEHQIIPGQALGE